jgi:hypothetical protein
MVEVCIAGLQLDGGTEGSHGGIIVTQPVSSNASIVVCIAAAGVQGQGCLIVS